MFMLCRTKFVVVVFLMCFFVELGTCSPAFSQSGEDYMSLELRAQVEKLKKDVAREPTTRNTLVERTRVFWN